MEKNIKSAQWRLKNVGKYHKEIKLEAVYGPINSRRLGLSLGINPIQGGFACNWSCVYCQYGKDSLDDFIKSGKIRFSTPEEIKIGLEKRLSSNEHYDSISIVGPTEPTLSPDFDKIVDLTVEMRNKYRPDISTALITNSSKLIGLNLKPLNYVYMKLDIGNEETFQKFNRPRETTLEQVVNQIKGADVDKKVIQTMLCSGEAGNFNIKNISDYIGLLKEINPEEVHLYSLLYIPFPNIDVSSVNKKKMNLVADRIKSETDSDALVFVDPVKEGEQFRF